MSTTIDNRVVEMRFDNKQFEQNARTSISTLEKLKQSLNLSGAAKGISNITSVAKNSAGGIKHIADAATEVGHRFSVMEIMGITSIANLTNSAVNAGKRMVSALTIDPVKTGFSEYELKTDSIKTILASTGEPLEKVNKLLNELNQYSDETIYSFSDMTQNIGKFTNAGIKLEDAVMAIKGISNEAAVSGANANEASRAMYNFSQALSAGYVKLIDWKSIENANMATKEFKQELIDTAVSLGTVTKSGDDMYQTLSGNTFNAVKNFNEVFQDEWMTSEVLIETLKRYADETTDIGKKAKAAAQDVTKFTQIFDIAKETAQSGWARTWELLFGDINQAKALFTPISEFLNGIINGISDARNAILESALASPFKGMKDILDKAVGSVEAVTKATENLGKVVDDVIGGKWGSGQERWDKLTEAGYDWAEVQNKVNEKLGSSVRHTSKLSESQKDLQKSQQRTIEQVMAMSDAELKDLGLKEKEIKSLRELQEQSERTGIPIEELVKDIDRLSGRSLLIESFKNAARGLSQIFKAMKDAWTDIFPPKSTEDRAKGLYNIIAAMRKFTWQFRLMMANTGKDGTFDKLKRTFKGIFALIDIALTVIGGPLKFALKGIFKLLGMADIDILSVTASIGDAIVAVRDWIDENNIFAKGLEIVLPYLKKIIDGVKDWVDSVKDSDIAKFLIEGFVKGIKEGPKRVFDAIMEFGRKVIEWFNKVFGIESPAKTTIEMGGYLIEGLIVGIKEGAQKVFKTVTEFGSSVVSKFKEMFPAFTDAVGGFFDKLFDFISKIDIGQAFVGILGAGIFLFAYKLIDSVNLLAEPLKGLRDMFEGLGDMFEGLGKKFKAEAWEARTNGILNLAKAIGILALATFIFASMSVSDLLKAGAAIIVLAGIIALLAWAMNKMSQSSTTIEKGKIHIEKGAISVFGIGMALLLMAAAMKVVSTIKEEDIMKTCGLFAVMVAGMALLITAFGLFVKGDAAKSIGKAGKLLTKMSIAMLIMVGVIKLASMLEPGEVDRGLKVVGEVGLLFIAIIAVSKLAGENATKAGKMIFKMSLAILIMLGVIKLAGMLTPGEIVNGLGVIAILSVFFAMMISVSQNSGKYAGKIGTMMLLMAASLAIMVYVIKKIGEIKDPQVIAKGITTIAALSLIFAMLITVAKGSGKNAGKVGAMLLMMSGAIAILAGVIYVLSMIKDDGLTRAVGAIAAVTLCLIGMMVMTRYAKMNKNTSAVLTKMVVAIVVMALAITLLSFLNPDRLKNAVLAIGSLMIIFGLLIAVTKIAQSSKNMQKTLLIMIGAVVVLAGVITALSFIDSDKALKSTLALGILMTAFVAMILVLSKAKSLTKTMTKSMYSVLGIVIILTAIVAALSFIDATKALKSTGVLALLMAAFVAMLVVLSKSKSLTKTMNKSLYSMVGVIVILALVVALLSVLDSSKALKSTLALVGLLAAFVGMFVILSKVGKMSGTSTADMYKTLGVVAGLAVIMGLLAAACSKLGELKLSELAKGLVGIGVLLLGVSLFLSNTKFGTSSLSTAVSIIALAAAIKIMASAITDLGGMTWEGLAKGLIALGGSMAILVLGLNLMKGTLAGSAALVVAALALAIFAPVLAQLGSLGWDQIGKGLLAIAGAFVVLGLAGALLSPVVPAILGLSAALVLIGIAVLAAGAGVKLLAEGLQLLGEVLSVNATVIAEGLKLIILELIGLVPAVASAIGEGIQAFCQAIIDAAPTIGEAVLTIITTIAGVIVEAAPAIGEAFLAIIQNMITVVGEAVPAMAECFYSLITTILQTLATYLPDIVQAGFDILLAILQGIRDNIGEVTTTAIDIVLEFINAISSKLEDIIQAGFDLIISFINGLSNAIDENIDELVAAGEKLALTLLDAALKLITGKISTFKEAGKLIMDSGLIQGIKNKVSSFVEACRSLIEKGVQKIKDWFEEFKTTGSALITKFISGVKDKYESMKTAAGDLIAKGKKAIEDKFSDWIQVGKDLIAGLIQGIKDKATEVVDAAKGVVDSAIEGAKNLLGINSPSRVFAEMGRYVDEGFVKGLVAYTGRVTKAAENVGESAIDPISKIISTIPQMLNDSDDFQPTIRPVLDLSSVESGVGAIGGLFGNQNVGVSANLGAVNSIMSSRQNGDSAVLSAIDKLGKQLGGAKGDTYIIDGVTYDDGSNIASAVETIIRAARVERRA